MENYECLTNHHGTNRRKKFEMVWKFERMMMISNRIKKMILEWNAERGRRRDKTQWSKKYDEQKPHRKSSPNYAKNDIIKLPTFIQYKIVYR